MNSINWARILAQVVYYFYAGLRVMRQAGAAKVCFAVPTGNFGDIFAGYVAWRMGLPIGKLVLAANENDILARFFETGNYERSSVKPSLSPSMDIQAASNFERYLFYRLDCDPSAVRSVMRKFEATGKISASDIPVHGGEDIFVAGRAGDAETVETIRSMYDSYGCLIDPHTAVAVHVAWRHLDPAEPMICLATAHPAKFSRAVELALGKNIARHPALDALEKLPTRCARLSASADALREFIAGA